MIVCAHMRCGGRMGIRGVTVIRDCGDYLEMSRPGESPRVLRSDTIAKVEVEPEQNAVLPCCYEAAPDAA